MAVTVRAASAAANPFRIDNHSHSRWNRSGSIPARRKPVATVYVCICNGVTERQIREAAAHGCTTTAELTMRTGCGANCGTCLETAMAVLESVHAATREPLFPILTLSHAA